MIPADIVSLADYERHALKVLPPQALAYIQGGAEDECCLQRNLNVWKRWEILPRVLRPMHEGSTTVSLLNREHESPILVAPVAYHKLAHPEGELASSLAAAALGVGYILSTQSSYRLEEVSKNLERQIPNPQERAPLWFQLYIQHDRAFTLDLIKRAESHGYEALVLTVDAPIHGIRNREQRAQFQLPHDPENPHSPFHVEAVNLRDMKPDPNAHSTDKVLGSQGYLSQTPTWNDVEWLQAHTKLPVLLKGILHPDDALRAYQMGLQGVIVSNHGGRTLDSLPTPVTMLPKIREAIGIPTRVKSETPFHLLVDGGIRRGSDVFKALALGADAVLIGRPILHALAVGGIHGVAHALKILKTEFEMTLALAGCPHLSDLGMHSLQKASF